MPTTNQTPSPYDPAAIFAENGPINPSFMHEAVRTLMRALPLGDPTEPQAWGYRRMHSAMLALATLRPRDEIEVMLGVQALSAYHAASACWRIGMNLRTPHGDSTRHVTTAASAARTFDTLLRALERRQAKPIAPPNDLPEPRIWAKAEPVRFMQEWEDRCSQDDLTDEPHGEAVPPVQWTNQACVIADEIIEQDRTEQENAGLDIANTEGILPDGGMVMPETPTPQQAAYIARRLALMYRREIAENKRKGITRYPKIRPLRTGDRVP